MCCSKFSIPLTIWLTALPTGDIHGIADLTIGVSTYPGSIVVIVIGSLDLRALDLKPFK
tara:strand:- start:18 stop:194 length:177 start_codon:yes stop_codon:yes gene_type:complete